ncbi:hypothetical protein [Hasllibacter sp. MH4015]|uniref:hypothetical protein n=1 Tax=Hasllibacter sp. MH4015 TaxID=2854029 RepID=UPI001CD4DB77|nr:hypothetical protein [Hasllibacter sp. MH4015]
MADDAKLHAAIALAERSGDWSEVIALYREAADTNPVSEAFYLTHAYVHALEANDPVAKELKARLVALNAEAP